MAALPGPGSAGPACAVVDYGAGNLASVRRGLAAAGADVRVTTQPGDLDAARLVVVPGVGHFAATRALDAGWRDAIRRAIDRGAVLLGICLGMQWLFEGSTEADDVPGLGLLAGRCDRLPGDAAFKVPHVGWNTLDAARPGAAMLAGLRPGASAYFTHAFAAPPGTDTVAVTTHGVTFASAVERGRVFGTQFHPEKSGVAGRRMLANVVRLAADGGR
ncbi:MAG: imidazole glycerol phosphate synthase subunit HisH [Vicinamibacterales bacterium]